MRRWPLFVGLLVCNEVLNGQALTVDQMLTVARLRSSKVNSFIASKGYVLGGSETQNDTLIQTYFYRPKRKNDPVDTIQRNLIKYCRGEDLTIMYQTASADEFRNMHKQFISEGFFGKGNIDSISSSPMVFQQKDMFLYVGKTLAEEQELFYLKLQKRHLPALKEIMYAEDLLAFDSHENLEYIFGKENVKRDVYYFSEKEYSRCSVLYPNSNQQAVFIWQDEGNDCHLSYLVLGGQLMFESSFEFHHPITENIWISKNRVRAGMSLRELRRLNGVDFTFYNINSPLSGMVIPDGSGRIDFHKEGIVLACMNCEDLKQSVRETISADEAISQGRSFFVFSIMLFPSSSSLVASN